MSHYQFELATRTEQRTAHAATKGFCGAHTWYYAEIGSPLGISAAYARLGEATAASLVEAAASAVDVAQLRTALIDSQASSGGCPACARLDAVRGEITQDLRARFGRSSCQPVPALCIGHGAELLARGLDVEAARRVVSATADRLKRRSEDMRTYSLKRESLRRALVDKEEEAAYLDATSSCGSLVTRC